ncbi:HTH domain-containing protein [Candidatus Pacearchaeota archaeon]|nr:HTH domain-containing protein [Candidatus Pacearchaeota archaeon]
MKKGTILSMNKSTFKSTIKRSDIKEKILDMLENSKKPLSTAEIASNLGKSWHTVIRYCLDLEIEGKIFKFELGRIAAWQVKK